MALGVGWPQPLPARSMSRRARTHRGAPCAVGPGGARGPAGDAWFAEECAAGRGDAGPRDSCAGAWDKEQDRGQVLRYASLGGFLGCLGKDIVAPSLSTAEDLREELQDAILSGDFGRVEAALVRGAPLLPHYRTCKAVPKAGVESATAVLVNPVDWAALEGCPKVARRLLERADQMPIATADLPARVVRCAVHVAARRAAGAPRWLELLRALLARGADAAQLDPWGRSALHLAVMGGSSEAAEALLERGAWEAEAQRDEVLRLALSQRVAAVVELGGSAAHAGATAPPALEDVQTRAELEEVSGRLHRELAQAVKKGDLLGVRAVLDRGAPLEADVDLGYGLHGNFIDWAVWHRREAVAVTLLKIGDDRGDGLGHRLAAGARHAVFWAVQQDFMEVLEALLARGADAAQRDELCGTALRCAVEQSRPAAAAALLGAGAWEGEPEKERVSEMLKDRGLLRAAKCGSGRGLGIADEAARDRLEAAVHAALPRSVITNAEREV